MENEPFLGDLLIQSYANIWFSIAMLVCQRVPIEWVYVKNVENPAFMDQIWSYK